MQLNTGTSVLWLLASFAIFSGTHHRPFSSRDKAVFEYSRKLCLQRSLVQSLRYMEQAALGGEERIVSQTHSLTLGVLWLG